MTGTDLLAIRGRILHCLDAPGSALGDPAVASFDDGLLLVDSGRIVECGPFASLASTLPADLPIRDRRGCLLIPGLIDCHVHYPQMEVIGSYGSQLLEWLERYTYPAETRYSSPEYAEAAANLFVRELLCNGTTTAMVFPTVHAHSVDAFFEVATGFGLRMICGKVMMDRHCPAELADTAQTGYSESRALAKRWHGNGRLSYAITPRFAATSSPAQLASAGRLAEELPDAYIHTHLAETHAELAWVAELYPKAKNYLDVYDRYGLVRERSVFAHCLHLSDAEVARMADAGAAVAFCPSSNLFLGSGLFDCGRLCGEGIPVGLGSDVGAGTSLNILRTASEGYKVLQLRGQTLTPLNAFYQATLGGARTLGVDSKIGNFAAGKEADFVVLDPSATPLGAFRQARSETIEETLFALMTLADDRFIKETYAMGQRVHQRDET